ncbi:MAG: hypothetical protein JST30_04990 [Armatimonadetes bacterium]|nr:hypothetical protein [Armatimonadota bacterium]
MVTLSVRAVGSCSADEGAAVVIEFCTSDGHTVWRLPVLDGLEADDVQRDVASRIRDVLDRQEQTWSETRTWIQRAANAGPDTFSPREHSRFGEGGDTAVPRKRAAGPH